MVKSEVIEKLAALITAAFGLVAALAWNDAIKSLFKGPCGTEGAGALCSLSSGGPWLYAVIVTIVAVIAAIWIGRAAERAKQGGETMKAEVIEKLAALITAAFGLVAALAWNDAIKSLFKGPCGTEGAGALCSLSSGGPWLYAVIVTIVAVIATIWIARASERAKN